MQSYEKEAEKQREKINKMKGDNADVHDIKKQEEVLAETLHMLPDTSKRLETAKLDLVEHMVRTARVFILSNRTPSKAIDRKHCRSIKCHWNRRLEFCQRSSSISTKQVNQKKSRAQELLATFVYIEN